MINNNNINKDENKQQFFIQAKKFELENIGKIFSPLKQKFIWYFTINKLIHKIELITELITNNREIILDNNELYNSGSDFFSANKFDYKFQIDNCWVEIVEFENYFELFLDSQNFKNLYIKELENNTNLKNINIYEQEFLNHIKISKKLKDRNPFEEDLFKNTIDNLNKKHVTPFD